MPAKRPAESATRIYIFYITYSFAQDDRITVCTNCINTNKKNNMKFVTLLPYKLHRGFHFLLVQVGNESRNKLRFSILFLICPHTCAYFFFRKCYEYWKVLVNSAMVTPMNGEFCKLCQLRKSH